MALRILHISDLHERAPFKGMPKTRKAKLDLDKEERGYVLGNSFLNALEEIAKPGIDLVCLTGDVADWGHPKEYRAATTRIERILKTVGVPKDRFFAVPGNHDVQRNIAEGAWRGIRDWYSRTRDGPALGRWFREVAEPPHITDSQWRNDILKRTAAFWKWFGSFHADLRPQSTRLLGFRKTLPPGTFANINIDVHIIGLDSAWLCGGADDQGNILLTEEQVSAHVRNGENPLTGFRIALIHHPLTHLADYEDVRPLLADDVDLVLHGHQHRPAVITTEEPGARLRVMAAGCLIEGDLGKNWPNEFHLIEVDVGDRAGEVHFRKWSRNARYWAKGSDIYREAPDGVLQWSPASAADAARAARVALLAPRAITELERYLKKTTLIGRDKEIKNFTEILNQPDVRLLTVTGPSGVGKTALAKYIAATLVSEFRDKVAIVELAAAGDQTLLESEIGNAMEDYKQTVDVPLIDFLRGKERLILLDNCDTVINSASVVTNIIRNCPAVKLLATSQQPLATGDINLSTLEETACLLPLSYPRANSRTAAMPLTEYASVKLFIARAEATGTLELSTRNLEAIAAICQEVNGLPLCIEILASFINKYEPPELLELLREHGFAELDHEQQLSRTIEIRYAKLAPREKTLFRRLAIFVGGCSFEAVDKICRSVQQRSVKTPLQNLVDRSFVQLERGRYHMLQVIRDYAHEHLEASGEAALLRCKYAKYYLQLAKNAEPQLKTASRKKHLSSLEQDYDNFRAVFHWSIDPEGQLEIGLSLAGALFWYWDFLAYFQEGQRQVKRLLKLATFQEPPKALAGALYCDGGLAFLLGDYPDAEKQLTKSVEMWRIVGDRARLSYALIILGMVKKEIGEDLCAAREHEEESVRLLEGDDDWGHALALNDLGNVMVAQGEAHYSEARKTYEESLRKWEHVVKDPWGRSLVLSNLSSLACKERRYDDAYVLMRDALDIQLENNDKWGRAWSLKGIGEAKLGQQNYAPAAFNFYESFCLHSDLGRKQLMAECLEGLAKVAAALKQADRGALLVGAAEQLRREAGSSESYVKSKEYEALLHNLRADMNEMEFENAKAEGFRLTQEQLQQLVNSYFEEWNHFQIATIHMSGSAAR